MKTNLYLLAASCCLLSNLALSQNAIPNGSFENWNTAVFDYPQNYPTTSNPSAVIRCNSGFNCVKTTDAYHGATAVKLTTIGSGNNACTGYFISGFPNGSPTSFWPGGMPYTQKPHGIRGYYKSTVPAGDTARILAYFKSGGHPIGAYVFALYGTHGSYTPFAFTFSPALTVTPDTVIFAAASSDFMNKNLPLNGSMLQIDSVSFTGVTSQPALMNGDFELWQSKTINSPNSWYLNTDDQGDGIYRTTDAAKGNYALELKTYLGNNNNTVVAAPGQVSTGFCSGNNCIWKGGYPFTNMTDTLSFYYKYIPSGNDSANLSLQFKKNGSSIFSMGKNLHASASYTYVEIPLQLGQTPDSVIVQIGSSSWQDSSLTYVGSDLKIDEIQFKSQPLNTGILEMTSIKQVFIFPNPSVDGSFQIRNTNPLDEVRIYNCLGESISAYIARGSDTILLQMSDQASGVYFVLLTHDGHNQVLKLSVVQK